MRVTTADLDDAAGVAVDAGGAIAAAVAPPLSAAGPQPTGAALAALYAAIATADGLLSGGLTSVGGDTANGSTSYTHTDASAARTVTLSC